MIAAEPSVTAYHLAALHMAWEEFGPAIPVASLTHCGGCKQCLESRRRFREPGDLSGGLVRQACG